MVYTSGSVRTKLQRSALACRRLDAAVSWLAARSPADATLVVAANSMAAREVLREAGARVGAFFGWEGTTLGGLAAALATRELIGEQISPLSALAGEAVTVRVLHDLKERGGLGRYADVADGPGLARSIARTLAELRLQDVGPARLVASAADLAAIALAFEARLLDEGLADRAAVFRMAAAAASDPACAHPLLGRPVLFLDVPLATVLETALVERIAARARAVCAVVPAGDEKSWHAFRVALQNEGQDLGGPVGGALQRVQLQLFDEATQEPGELDDRVAFFSAPGESRECVEIARRILALAEQGMRFDRMAIALRSPQEYRPHLEEALTRGEIPSYFARGEFRPHPAGRAFLALLRCAAERLSARRFAEYLAMGEAPANEPASTPSTAMLANERWAAPDDECVTACLAAPSEPSVAQVGDGPEPFGGAAARVGSAGPPSLPQRWEKIMVDAAVIGGIDRWRRRLTGLEHELQAEIGALGITEDPTAKRVEMELTDLRNLQSFALPLLEELERLPGQATWAVWLGRLATLTCRALRRPDSVLSVLAELAPLGEVGPVELSEVLLVLADRLGHCSDPPSGKRYGRVFVAPVEDLRGLCFDVVFVPGLAERLFPRKIAEDPILLDTTRKQVAAHLVTNEDRVPAERLALRIAIGAARERLVFSYPRLDLDRSRPRVPSFYALEMLRAATGRLPDFNELASRAEATGEARIGWPAPRNPESAIDAAEHDLALIESLMQADADGTVGAAHYLLGANPHLARALRSRARRWLRRWTPADGLIAPESFGREAMRAHALGARSYSPTALEKYAVCPYQFFLYAIHRIGARRTPEAVEEMSPLQHGLLVHATQFELLRQLEEHGLLPLDPARLPGACDTLDEVLGRVAARFRDDLAPAIDRVWQDGIDAVRADLREWLRRSSEDGSGWVPWRFELAFGLEDRSGRDPASVVQPVALDCGILLRGAIDLVERRADGALRATDHKTGVVSVARETVVQGGRSLQPLLYALALEKLFVDSQVDSGRLYYCSTRGAFEERVVHLNPATRRSALRVAEILQQALEAPFLPAAPAPGACERCDYRVVCGPYEELRVSRKPRAELQGLDRLRQLR